MVPRLLRLLPLLCATGLPSGAAYGQTPAKPAPAAAVVRNRQEQVKAALAWLVKNQKEDGSWAVGLGENRPAIVVATSWSGMALLASADPRYRPHVKRAANFVAVNIFKDPFDTPLPEQWDQGNWKVAVGGLFLCEYYAALKRDPAHRSPALEQVLASVVKESCKRMEPSGGWGHTSRVKNALGYIELEVMSNWMLATLGAARRLGLKVPAEDLKRAVQYVEDCCHAEKGGVAYSTTKELKEFGCPCRTGGAIFAFATLGRADTPACRRMVTYWRREMGSSGEGHGSVALGLLGSALAARQLDANAWRAFQEQFVPKILGRANADGSFKHLTGATPHSLGCDDSVGPAYNTGIYALILQLDRGSLRFLGRQQQ